MVNTKPDINGFAGFPGAGSVLLIALTVASAMALVGVIYVSYKSRRVVPFGYHQLNVKSDRLLWLAIK